MTLQRIAETGVLFACQHVRECLWLSRCARETKIGVAIVVRGVRTGVLEAVDKIEHLILRDFGKLLAQSESLHDGRR